MTLEQQIAAKLAVLNTPQQIQGRSGVVWGYDPQNRRWFTEGPRQRRSYANTTMGIPASVGEGANVSADGNVMDPGKGGGVLHGNQEWDDKAGRFVTPFSWDKLGFYGTLAALTGGAANAFMAGGAAPATAGASGVLPSSTIPAATGTLTTGAVAAPSMTGFEAAVLPSLSGYALPASTIPAANNSLSTLPGSATQTAATTTTAGVGQQILNALKSREGAAALMSLLPLLAARSGGGNSGLGNLDTSRLNGLLDMTTERAKRTDPLHQSVTQLAMSRLPTGVQR